MDFQAILSKVDHTLLSPEATWEEIRAICDEGIKYGTASVCIPPSYVARAKEYVGEKLKICTVVGFPNGYNTTAVKFFETEEAVRNGADEIDMVINIGWLKDKNYDAIVKEIQALKIACGDKVLKVIIETGKLNRTEKIQMCQIVSAAGADFIKTSTGFCGGATKEDVKLFADCVEKGVQIKAAGGISSMEDAREFIKLGATRLGTSRIVKLVKNEETKEGSY